MTYPGPQASAGIERTESQAPALQELPAECGENDGVEKELQSSMTRAPEASVSAVGTELFPGACGNCIHSLIAPSH